MGKAARKTALLKSYARGWSRFEPVVITEEMRRDFPELMHCSSVWANNRVEAHVFQIETAIGGVNQLTLIRHGDIEPLSYQEIQRAVHELFGPEVSAVEIYPPIEHEWQTNLGLRVVWVLPHTWQLPFGLHIAGSLGEADQMKPTPYTEEELRDALRDRQAGQTLQQFAAEVGISFQFLSQILNGTRSVNNERVLEFLAPPKMKYVKEAVYILLRGK